MIRLLLAIIFLPLFILFQNCSGPSGTSAPAIGAIGGPDGSAFWITPAATTIGAGQYIATSGFYNSTSNVPYPAIVNPSQITWASSNSTVASVSAGSIAGLTEGTAIITANYLNFAFQINILVSGKMMKRTLVVGGVTRDYYIYIPPITDKLTHPLVLSLHGGGGTAMNQAGTSQFNQLAQVQKFYVVYPDGLGSLQTFNGGACCGYAQANNIDDVSFISAVISDAEANYSINAAKIYATGFSDGAIMSHRLACNLSTQIAGFMSVSGGTGELDGSGKSYYTCNYSRPIPILETHALNDQNYPFSGGIGNGPSGTSFYSIPSTISRWITLNNVSNVPSSVEVVTSTTTCYHYATPASDSPSAPVTLCKINPVNVYDATDGIIFGGGHSWPGGIRGGSSKADVPVSDFNADNYFWKYFGN